MQSLLSCTQTFEEDYYVHFVDACIIHIFEEMMSSDLLSSNCISTYLRYIRLSKMMMKYKEEPILLIDLLRNAPAAIILSVTHREDPAVYISSEEVILLIIHATKAFFKKHDNPIPFHENDLYRKVRALLYQPNSHY